MRNQKSTQSLTTAQTLSSIVKSCRDIMRKDKGLNGDLDRLPMLTWIMFLKFLDDMEQIREQEAKMSGKRFRPTLESPYRWRDWAAKAEGVTGDELISFVNNEEAVLPGRKKALVFSPTCAACKAPTAATGAMSLPRCSKAPSTA
jgi:type I restriction enzyme M protein